VNYLPLRLGDRGHENPGGQMSDMATYDDFRRLQMVAGRVTQVRDFPRARQPSYRLVVDFGPVVGQRESSVQAKEYYAPDDLVNTLVVAVVNLPPKNIAGFRSEALVLGVPSEDGSLSLLRPDRGAVLGGEVY
jgi:tRNA-binding protein